MEIVSLPPRDSEAALDALPLCVDLDGTLVKTDTLVESLLLLIKKNPAYLLLLPFWFLKGRAHLKQQIARRVVLDVTSLPYHSALLAYLVEQHKIGRKIILTTAADSSIAQRIASHLGLFSEVLATNGVENLAGANKQRQISAYLGSGAFVYAGNARIDLAIWRSAKSAIVVDGSNRLIRMVSQVTDISQVFNESKNPIRAFIRAIRVHQWVKNGLIFVPLLAGHHATDLNRLFSAILAFAAFSLCSSSTYLLNDLLDLEADRRHSSKKKRAFASGDLSVTIGLLATPMLLFVGLAVSLSLPLRFSLALCIYFPLTVSYSFYLKKYVIVDVILLALLYTLRIIGGGAATGIAISNWLLAFSMFLFLSLALLKRVSELLEIVRQSKEADKSRAYSTADTEQLASMGSASGYLTALVLGLYINSEDVKALYAHPEFLWLICPLILYWISRAWLVARRGHMDDDPVIFAIRDKASYAVGIAAIIIIFFATIR